MSRKPIAVSINENADGKSKPPKTATRKATSSTPKIANSAEKTNNSTRKPQAMKAPVETEQNARTEAEPGSDEMPYKSPAAPKRNTWGTLLLASVTMLITLGLGLWFTKLIEDLFAYSDWLGWVASALLAISVLSLIILVFREIFALWRLRKLGNIREAVLRIHEDKTQSSATVVDQIVGLYENRKEMGWHISRLADHADDVMDHQDRIFLTEQILMKPLDDEAKQIIVSASKRISVVTAVNPAASLDVLFTGYQILRMLRQLTALYGSRPGSLGTFRLAAMVGSHLAVTGGLALSDTLVQQFIGKGLAGRISAKLGEGTVNGIMTARIGLAALEICRPMPFKALEKPGLRQFISSIAGSFSGNEKDDQGVS